MFGSTENAQRLFKLMADLIRQESEKEQEVSNEWLVSIGFEVLSEEGQVLGFRLPGRTLQTHPERRDGSGARRWFLGNVKSQAAVHPRPRNKTEVLALLAMLGGTWKCT